MSNKNIVNIHQEKTFLHKDEYYYDILRKNIRKYRTKKNLTQQELADLAELSREYVCDIENKKRNKHPSIATIGRIADGMKINIGDLFKEQ